MIVVADTSPLNYLIQIHQEVLLPQLFGRVMVPTAVLQELKDQRAPVAVRRWVKSAPAWLTVLEARGKPDAGLLLLDKGEREAIQLALEQGAELILLDEYEGRLAARDRNLNTTGVLGVLQRANRSGLVDGAEALGHLLNVTNFRLAEKVRVEFLASLRR